jgi:hypothetical protein
MVQFEHGWQGMALMAMLLGTGIQAQVPAPPPPHRQLWDLGQYSWLRLAAKEGNAPGNDVPTVVSVEFLVQRLGSIRATTADGEEALFGAGELATLAKAMAAALSQEGPGEDLLLFSTSRRSQGFLSSPLAVTARLFLKDGALNIIVQEARMEILGYPPQSDWSRFEYGSRNHASKVALQSPTAQARRGDWLSFVLEPAPAPALVEPPKPAAPVHPEQEERLRALKHLLDEKLITDKEYKAKRAEIIKSL